MQIEINCEKAAKEDIPNWGQSTVRLHYFVDISGAAFPETIDYTIETLPQNILPHVFGGVQYFVNLNAEWRVASCHVVASSSHRLVAPENPEDPPVKIPQTIYHLNLTLIDTLSKRRKSAKTIDITDDHAIFNDVDQLWTWATTQVVGFSSPTISS